MISFFQNKPIRINSFYFIKEDKEYLDNVKNSDLDIIVGTTKSIAIAKKNIERDFNTYLFDLNSIQSVDTFISQLNSTIRNSIHYCINNGVKYEFFDQNITDTIINDFVFMLKEMYKQKGLSARIVSKKRLKEYANKGLLMISRTIHNNEIITQHVYVKDANNTVLWFSCSLFRGDKSFSSFVGKCNRYHHYMDIKHFYLEKFKIYDWGGISSFEKPNGIDVFKMSFPGTQTTMHEYFIPKTLMGKLYVIAKKY